MSTVMNQWFDRDLISDQATRDYKKAQNIEYYSHWKLHHSNHINHTLKQHSMNLVQRLIDKNKTYYLLTYSCSEGHTFDLQQSKKMCYYIRSKHIQFLFQNHKPNPSSVTKPAMFPRQWFFIEPKNDRYHIHVLMEAIDPRLFIKKLAQSTRFRTIFHRLTEDKLFPRNQDVISQKMIDRFERYVEHQHYGRTYNLLDISDDWLISRLLVEYIMHRTDNEKWGVIGVHQSPACNHSKVMNESEALSKVEYLNKDEFFKIHSDIQGENFCYEYSDLI